MLFALAIVGLVAAIFCARMACSRPRSVEKKEPPALRRRPPKGEGRRARNPATIIDFAAARNRHAAFKREARDA